MRASLILSSHVTGVGETFTTELKRIAGKIFYHINISEKKTKKKKNMNNNNDNDDDVNNNNCTVASGLV